MKSTLRWAIVLFLCAAILWLSTPLALAARERSPQTLDSSTGIRAAHTLSLITGVAISPLLGVSSVGLYHWWKTPSGQRANLPWFAHPWFWIPALLIVGLVAAKDILGTAAPTVLKKPFDVAETVENKFSGLIAAGAFVPWVVSLLSHGSGAQSLLLPSTSTGAPAFSTIDGTLLASALGGPLAILVFLVVWLAAHTINVLILLSPFTTLDTALKAFRMGLLSLVVATAALNPFLGALFAAILIGIAWAIAGWSFRLTVFGTVYTWDFVTGACHRFEPAAGGNWMFTASKALGAPVRTYGKLAGSAPGKLTFYYRPWLVLKERSFVLPVVPSIVGKGLFYPDLRQAAADQFVPLFVLPPRYRTHEQKLASIYGLDGVRDVGLRKGLKAMWDWLRNLIGLNQRQEQPPTVIVG